MIKWIVAPIVGGVIGYITNDLAIRMLFHPRKSVYIGKFHVPFTPGLIPKQKERIARSIGSVVSSQLLNEETLKQTLLSDATVQKLQDSLRTAVHRLGQDERTVDELLKARFDQDTLVEKAQAVERQFTIEICARINEAGVGKVIVDSVTAHLMESLSQNRLLSMLLDANAREALKAKAAVKVNEIVADRAPSVVYKLLDDARVKLQGERICDLYHRFESREDALISAVTALYVTALGDNVGKLLQAINIEQIVVDKINGFDAAQLEAMIFGIMKKELNAIVYLGAALGFLMGFINVIF